MITQLRKTSDYSLTDLLQAFDISSSGYHHHTSVKMTAKRLEALKVVAEMKRLHADPNLRCYGSPRMVEELWALGYQISENTVAKLMQEHGLVAKGFKAFKVNTTTPDPRAVYNPNLLKDQRATRFGEVLVADITYIRTKEGWLYLSVVIDLFTRTILGHSISNRMPAGLVVQSLTQAVKNWNIDTRNAIFHSDRGSQYTSREVRMWLKKRGITQSMSAQGNCYDNATCESFFAGLKRELLPECGYFENAVQARAAIFNHVHGFYNTRRRHSSLGMLSPTQFLEQQIKLQNQQDNLALPA